MFPELLFFDKMRLLREALGKCGSAAGVLSLVRGLLSDDDVRREHLNSLNTPDWVAPLRDAGYFAHPPGPVPTETGGLRFPPWPESMYLARMGGQVPEVVCDVFAQMDTENPSIIGDMIEAAKAMPTRVAAGLVRKIIKAVQAENVRGFYYRDASEVCLKLAEGGEAEAATNLAVSLFTPKVGKREARTDQTEEYCYKDGLKKVAPVLGELRPLEFLPKLCDWLVTLLKAESGTDEETASDFSSIWRPAIEEHEQNGDYNQAAIMVGFVRAGFERAIRKRQLTLGGAVEMLAGRRFIVFKRIGLHLCTEFAEQSPELARQTMMTRDFYDDYHCRHEYARLVGRRFDLLTNEEREKWFGWVDAGPDMKEFEVWFKRASGRDASDEDRQKEVRYRQFEKLHSVRNHLHGEREGFYQAMLAQNGPPFSADLGPAMVDCGGSPYTIEQLTGITFEKAVEMVASWAPDRQDGSLTTSVEGLAGTFRRYVATDPVSYSQKAGTLKGRPAPYVREFIGAMGEAAKTGLDLSLPAVFDLCRWVLHRPLNERTIAHVNVPGRIDMDWQWTRDEISQFVRNVCEATTGQEANARPKYQLEGNRECLWAVVRVLCRGRADSYIVHDAAKGDPRAYDYLNMAINSPRGKAVGAALEYARWVANHIKQVDGRREIVPHGFDAMPEVRRMLDWQIAKGNGSVEALAVIGSRIGLIYWIDKGWLSRKAGRIFHLKGFEEGPVAAEGWAAWNAFLVWVNAHIEFYNMFRRQYAYAVNLAAKVKPGKEGRGPIAALGEHLMLLYGRGNLGLEQDGQIVRRFISTAKPDTRRNAIGFVGRMLGNDKEIPAQIIERFQALWEVYWSGPGRRDAKASPRGWTFGPWFSCGKFPAPWSLEQLERYVAVAPMPEPDHQVAEQLAKLAPSDVPRAVRILDRMVRGDHDGWHVQSWREHAMKILEEAMRSVGDAQAMAVELINYLGRRGYMEFGKLLEQ